MSQDIVADALNQIMNAKQVEKTQVTIRRYSKVLVSVLEIMKAQEYIDYTINEDEKELIVTIHKLNKCRAVKPRYATKYTEVERYLRRFLPSRNFGIVIISTNKGMMTHQDAIINKAGGSVVAYAY